MRLKNPELIRGITFKMSAAPISYHKDISRNLCTEITNFLKGKPLEAIKSQSMLSFL